MSEIKYFYQPKMTRVEKLELADSLLGKQLWLTHYFRGKYFVELEEAISRNVQYVTLKKDGTILICFNDGVIPLSAYGDVLFDSIEMANSELAYRNRRNNCK